MNTDSIDRKYFHKRVAEPFEQQAFSRTGEWLQQNIYIYFVNDYTRASAILLLFAKTLAAIF